MGKFGWRFLLGCNVLLGTGTLLMPAKAEKASASRTAPLCPAELEVLTTELLTDLPNYANRAYVRLGIPNNYVIAASRPHFEPLLLGPGQRAIAPENFTDREDPYQIFFTTLERNYQGSKPVQLQLYHWLFLTRTESTWRLALMYSITGPYPGDDPPSPPQDSSEGSLAQAIRTWLRDYRSGCIADTAPKRTGQD